MCYVFIGGGSKWGIFILFVYGKNGPAFFYGTWLHAIFIKFKMSGKMGSNLVQPVFMFSFYKYFIRNKY